MTIGPANDQRLQGADAFTRLVVAILETGTAEPETDALEWKSTLDLSEKKARFDLARHILGFGNRSVRQASRWFGGYAYIAIGVEPGKLCGITMPDPADLSSALAIYVAPERPGWLLHYVSVYGLDVAIVEIAPPREGDRICCLQKTFEGKTAGRIFIRRGGRTEEATPADVRDLEDRYAAAAVADARSVAQLHDLATEQLALARVRDRREAQDRAERDAPTFTPSGFGPGGEYIGPDEVRGTIRNDGNSAALVTDVRLGSIPGAIIAAYGSEPQGGFGAAARVEPGVDASIRFADPSFAALATSDEPLTLKIEFSAESGFAWRETLTLRREQLSGRQNRTWTIRPGETRRQAVGELRLRAG